MEQEPKNTESEGSISPATLLKVPLAVATTIVISLWVAGWSVNVYVSQVKSEVRKEVSETYISWRDYLQRENDRDKSDVADLKVILSKLEAMEKK